MKVDELLKLQKERQGDTSAKQKSPVTSKKEGKPKTEKKEFEGDILKTT